MMTNEDECSFQVGNMAFSLAKKCIDKGQVRGSETSPYVRWLARCNQVSL